MTKNLNFGPPQIFSHWRMAAVWVSGCPRMGVVSVAYGWRIAIPKTALLRGPTYPYGVVSLFRDSVNYTSRRGWVSWWRCEKIFFWVINSVFLWKALLKTNKLLDKKPYLSKFLAQKTWLKIKDFFLALVHKKNFARPKTFRVRRPSAWAWSAAEKNFCNHREKFLRLAQFGQPLKIFWFLSRARRQKFSSAAAVSLKKFFCQAPQLTQLKIFGVGVQKNLIAEIWLVRGGLPRENFLADNLSAPWGRGFENFIAGLGWPDVVGAGKNFSRPTPTKRSNKNLLGPGRQFFALTHPQKL